uniref:Adenosine kinase n=1 Tax=Octactis speculum TaxID=3111310 RepID=A0A7S2DK21_9STRA|mmetsp:Transcript_5039/g.6116  ORF Transcript_5039/g.6116 Transcript_5039/m.6116 type:complete len:354 (+) Transcript_5039:48-1109(+)|eukprot:CAMPEP_0185747560 /NCGR_PEP_ID=MMETSP1174-20130828/6177_1 /TAXON_ID=35687 /ORGANISM="Dictyocha speculum, Strain CCMP1381" /LENGTH=353 /DNA_ID=CAMNT_0028422787 /DNA_START=48 /DNA_END=1109 /DNA_ORIENTATION=+
MAALSSQSVGETSSTSLEGILLGAGNPLLDISATVPKEFLQKYNVKENDAILAGEEHMSVYTEMSEFNPQFIAGGATQNSIRVAQWMMKVPGATSYFGCVGSDAYATQMEEQAKADGVNVQYLVDDKQATGTCAVLITGEHRSLIANLAAANHFKPEHLENAVCKTIIDNAKFYYMAGFFLTVSLESIMKIGAHAVEQKKTVIMNLSAPFIVQFFWDQLNAALPFTDVMFGNESEAEAFGEKMEWGKDIETIAKNIAAMPKASGFRSRTVIITQGRDPTIVVQNGVVYNFPVDLLAPEQIVDTNGAGDAFAGGYLSELAKGSSLEKCVHAGNWAARVIIQQSGCCYPAVCEYE